MFGVTYDDETVFVLGGSPAFLSAFTDGYRGIDVSSVSLESLARSASGLLIDPYVAKVNTATMTTEVLTLPHGSGLNYIGSILAHENGLLYVVATATLYEIDPATLEIKRSLDLPEPAEQGGSAVYNTLTVWPATGDLITKRSDFLGRTPDELLLVDLDSMSVRAQTQADVGVARLTVAVEDDVTFVYVAGPTQTLRYKVSEEGFAPDTAWSQTYRSKGDGTQQGPAAVYMGAKHAVTFVDNGTVTLGITTPLSLFAQSTNTDSPITSAPVDSVQPGGVFPANSADPHRTGLIAALDNVNGISTGWQLTDDANLEKLWSNNTNALSAGSAIGVDQQHLYTDDRKCDKNGENCTLFLVVLDLGTGNELARVPVAGSLPTIGHIFVGNDAVFYIATEAGRSPGFLTRVTTHPD